MSDIDALLRALVARSDEADQTWLVLADLLEERADPRHEFIRLRRQPGYRADLTPESRAFAEAVLFRDGVRPCVPEWTNSLGMRFVWCPPGTFHMGSPSDEGSREDVEGFRCVTLTRGYWLGATQVTQAQWRAVTGSAPSRFSGDELPVENVSWLAATEFCTELVRREGLPYRLPTEAEWEYACRAGTTTTFWWGARFKPNFARANRKGNQPAMVGSLPPNPWGLHEISGNLWEWCADWFVAHYHEPATDPTGPETGTERVSRGGSWGSPPEHTRSACRNWRTPEEADDFHGLRVCLHLAEWPPERLQ